jgi:hypothetical protein
VKGMLILLLLSPAIVMADSFLAIPDFSQLLSQSDPEWPVEYVTIHKEEYERNSRASFCLRPVEMVDTIVFHHSETPTTTTAQQINDFHLNRGTPEDPWYMIAYSYVVNAPYAGSSTPKMKVTEGRPLEIVGAHAGSNAFIPMDNEQKKLWEEQKVLCGKEGEEAKFDPSFVKDGKIKANVTTLGVVINGNYAPFSRFNPGGYSKRSPRYPTKATQELLGKLSCQLQKKYPRIKYMKWHNYYTPTSCPGTIKNFVAQIRTHAKRYGCEFQ